MRILRTILVTLSILGVAAVASADYLVVERNATIKATASGSATVLSHPQIGTHLDLLNNGTQRKGYYRTTDPASAARGWIYHTLVSVHADEPQPPPVNPPVNNPPANPPGPVVAGGDTMRAHYIFLKQGNATLLEFSCGVLLIDAGGEDADSDDRLITYLSNFFSHHPEYNRTISALYLTHPHIDHDRDIENVVKTFTVRNYIHNGTLGDTANMGRPYAQWMLDHANDDGRSVNMEAVTETMVRAVPDKTGLTDAAIDPLACAGTDPAIRILSASYATNTDWSATDFNNPNNQSLVIRVDFGQASFLFPGDLEVPAIKTMLAYYAGTTTLDIDVYEVGHHGSKNGTIAEQLQAFTPKISVISAGHYSDHKPWTGYQYGHPRDVAVALLEQGTSLTRTAKTVEVASAPFVFHPYSVQHAIYATGWDGDIVIAADSQGHYDIQTDASVLPGGS